MPKLITCFHTGRVGKMLCRIDRSTNILCEDSNGERFVVLKRKPVPRPAGRKRERKEPVAEERTPWGAPIGGAPNPELLELAERIRTQRRGQ